MQFKCRINGNEMHCEENQLLRLLRLLNDEELIRFHRRAELESDSELAEILVSEMNNRSFKPKK